jgi:hypothetical protein
MKIVMVLAVFALLISCRNDKITAFSADCPDMISFSQDLEPLFINTCSTSGCHDATATAGYNLMGYDNIEANADVLMGVIRHVTGAPMPLGQAQWPAESIQKFQCWIDQGKLDN